MHLMHRAGEIGDGLMPVEHGGELDHDRRCLGQQHILQGQHIRRAIGNRVGTRAMIVTAGRIEEDHGDSAKRIKHCC